MVNGFPVRNFTLIKGYLMDVNIVVCDVNIVLECLVTYYDRIKLLFTSINKSTMFTAVAFR